MRVEQQPLVLQVVPPRSASDRDIVALETVMQGLALDDRHPVALEIARTAKGRQFMIRATSAAALEHLIAQIHARYPQASIHPLTEDPLNIRPGEVIAAVELRPGAASYLPLRSWRERELPVAGTDPLLGVLAAISHLPTTMRAVSQLALVPLPPTWSQGHRRRAVEHPLEPERLRQRRGVTASGSSAPSTAGIIAMGILVAVLLLWYRFARRLPHWILHAGTLLLHGKNPQLSSSQVVLLAFSLGGIAIAMLLVLLAVNWLLHRVRQTSIYDMRLVAEKTGRSAYRSRLRLFVIVSVPDAEGKNTGQEPDQDRTLSFVLRPQPLSSTRIKRISRQWWQTRRQQHEHDREPKEVLDRLTAAYRQYHTASGSYFVPHRLSARKAQRLLIQRIGLARFGRLVVGDLAHRATQVTQDGLEDQEVIALLGLRLTPCQWNILRLLLAHPLLSDEELGAVLNLQRRSVRCALYELHALGCLEPIPTEAGKRWHLCERGLRMMASVNHLHIRNIALWSDEEAESETSTVVQRGEGWLLQHMQHTAGVYRFFASLAQAARQQPGQVLFCAGTCFVRASLQLLSSCTHQRTRRTLAHMQDEQTHQIESGHHQHQG